MLLGAIALDLFAVLFGGAVALLPAIAEDRLGVGNVGYGWLRAAPGIGAVLLTALLAIRPSRRIGRTLFAAVAVFGAATIVFGATTSYAVAFVALIVLSGADAVSVFIRTTIVPLATPDHMRGRVMAVENVFIGASNELGAFESGVAATLLGVGPAVVLGGVLTLGVVGVWWLRSRRCVTSTVSRTSPWSSLVDRQPASSESSRTSSTRATSYDRRRPDHGALHPKIVDAVLNGVITRSAAIFGQSSFVESGIGAASRSASSSTPHQFVASVVLACRHTTV